MIRHEKSRCRRCGRQILLIKIPDKGKTLPFDIDEDLFVISDASNGGKRFITRDGMLLRGAVAQDIEKEHDKITGHACHFDTCPKGR